MNWIEAILAQEELGGSEFLFENGIPDFIPSEQASAARMAARQISETLGQTLGQPQNLAKNSTQSSSPAPTSSFKDIARSTSISGGDVSLEKFLAPTQNTTPTLSEDDFYKKEPYFLGQAIQNAPLLFVDWAPSPAEFQSQKALSDQAGMRDRLLKYLGLSFEQCAVLYFHKKPLLGRSILVREKKILAQFLAESIQKIKPQTILFLGESLAHVVHNQNIPLPQIQQDNFLYQNIPAVATYSLENLLQEQSLIKPTAAHLDKIKGKWHV
jgi:uracil-DNA glycosylase family 4